jgi:hypothetical protein
MITEKEAKQILKKMQDLEVERKQLIDFLIKRIEDSGIKKTFLAKQLDLSYSAFWYRVKNKSFTVEELEKLFDLLK